MSLIFEYFKAWSKNMQTFDSTRYSNKEYKNAIANAQLEFEKIKEQLLNEQFEGISTKYFG